jgi:hypothetical protein
VTPTDRKTCPFSTSKLKTSTWWRRSTCSDREPSYGMDMRLYVELVGWQSMCRN